MAVPAFMVVLEDGACGSKRGGVDLNGISEGVFKKGGECASILERRTGLGGRQLEALVTSQERDMKCMGLMLNHHGGELCERHGKGRSIIEADVKSKKYVVAGCNMVGVHVG
jgi:hypothetical protein